MADNKKRQDQPDRVKSNNENILDKHEDEKHTDPVPVEDQKIDQKNEKKKRNTQSDSSSEGLLDTEK
ncbi:hypothetical protein KP77_19950 [Jeotgalibacillus alimentarius]|uniref:Uncharacterized protein n=1 Tax=Jeotgalibacillus alimentarius TaxID=135826 RepID=A0A0C2S436_9BACL|nr:hypothetical protein [Jeotgalibacillus alimentarius]KIL48784.1 hypothetical protein KP77_19950 [Jeotgalibacillus alimentarius]